ncbi:lasso RiPP family leader peptide-containing protein [Streptomyces noursei]
MSEALHIEPADVYEPPLLAEAGDFTDLTQGGLKASTPREPALITMRD